MNVILRIALIVLSLWVLAPLIVYGIAVLWAYMSKGKHDRHL